MLPMQTTRSSPHQHNDAMASRPGLQVRLPPPTFKKLCPACAPHWHHRAHMRLWESASLYSYEQALHLSWEPWPGPVTPLLQSPPRLSTDACACGLPLPAAAPAVRSASNITTWACKTAQAVGRAHPLDRIKQGGPGGTPCERRTDSGYILPRGSTRITLQASSGYGTSAAGSPPHAQRVAPRWPTSHRLASRPLRPSTRQLDIACRFARVARPAQRPSEQPPAGRSS